MNLTTIPTPELQALVALAHRELQSRKDEYAVRAYSHQCGGKGNFHRKQHKHWAKTVENITDHHNAMAFEGDWLSIYQPNRITEGDFVLEFSGCKGSFRFFKAGHSHTITGTADNFIQFRNQCMKYFYHGTTQ